VKIFIHSVPLRFHSLITCLERRMTCKPGLLIQISLAIRNLSIAIEIRIRKENYLFLSIFWDETDSSPIQTETMARSNAYSEQIKSKWEYAELAMETGSNILENLHVSNYYVYLTHVLKHLNK